MLEENSRQNCFASSMLPSLLAYVGIKVEGNKHVLHMERTTACLLSTLSHGSLRNITTARRKNQMHWMHWTRTYRMYIYIYIQYIQCILAMRHFVARVPLSSCYGINRPRSTMIGSNKQRFMMLHDDFLFVPIWIAICEVVAVRYFNLRHTYGPGTFVGSGTCLKKQTSKSCKWNCCSCR